jgi:methylmalonyl-CoA mutase cobalamin-binding domain/chain
MSESLKLIEQLIVKGEDELIVEEMEKAIRAGIEVHDLLTTLNDGMLALSQQYDRREVGLPDLILAADAFKAAAELLKPLLDAKRGTDKALWKMVIGTVQYDIHNLGQDLVRTMMEVEGIECISLGSDVSADTFVKKVIELDANIIGLSALLTATMPQQKNVIDALTEAGIREKVVVMVGGAPVSQAWATKIGADGYAEDAIKAPKVLKQILLSKGWM